MFQSLSLAVRQIAAKVARAGLEGLYGVAEKQGGGSGDTQKKLDVIAVSISARAGRAALGGACALCYVGCCFSFGVPNTCCLHPFGACYRMM